MPEEEFHELHDALHDEDGVPLTPSSEEDRALRPVEAAALVDGADRVMEKFSQILVQQADITKTQKQIQKDQADAQRYAADTRRLVHWIVALCSVVVVLIIAIGIALFIALNAANDAKKATSANEQQRQQAVAGCLSANEFRTGERQLWEGLLDGQFSTPTTNQTPEQAAARAEVIKRFREFLDKQFALRDCTKV
jgi:large-conductance mechanosensitive channel